MKHFSSRFTNEQGSVMVVALIMLAFLTIIGVSASTTSNIELQIAGNERFHKIAFFHADSGIYLTPKLISTCVDAGEPQGNLANITYLDSNGESDPSDSTLDDIFYYEIMGYDEILGRDAHDESKDIRFFMGNHKVDVDVERTGQKHLVGGGTEFGSGAEGVGGGSTGGVAILFAIDSFGNGPSSALSNVEGKYRKVVGVVGGL
ncbi:MAG: pilus assembly PilX N-terminal domain-containing protein [Thermodesulfobacteriota bacterium]|nr:pilus assembly PilX N-terminal domain-containing protein [Thermodesulfobacteriota bacterium]